MTPEFNSIHQLDDFISNEEESHLLKSFKKLNTITSGNGLHQIRYGTPVYSKKLSSSTIPEHLQVYCDRLFITGLLQRSPRHVTVNIYDKGSFIGAHIDKIGCGNVITILSLASDAIMVLRRDEVMKEVILKRRSLLQLSKDARFHWTHETKPVSERRYSIVFRD